MGIFGKDPFEDIGEEILERVYGGNLRDKNLRSPNSKDKKFQAFSNKPLFPSKFQL
jgi:hypothetical protein